MFNFSKRLHTFLIIIIVFIFAYHIADLSPSKLTLIDAIRAAQPSATKWSRHARPVYIISTDAGEYMHFNHGSSGKRSNWNAIFVDPTTGHNLLVAIRHGQPRYSRQLLMAFKSPINVGDLKYDSPVALQAAHRAGKIIPGMTDFHFELRVEQHPVMRIYYRNSSSNYRLLSLDEKTCRFLP